MKKSTLLLLFNIFFLIISKGIFAQAAGEGYQGSMVAGTNKWFLISFSDAPPLKAKILSFEGDAVNLKDKNGNTRKVERNKITNVAEVPYGKLGNVGIGLGVPYGTLGINLEFNLIPYLAVTGGIGTTLFSGIGYNAGVKAYVRKPGRVWRPRASVYYGINGVYAEDINDPSNEKYTGFTGGIGQIFIWGRNGFDLDLMYIISSNVWDEHEGGGRIKISIGYRYAF